MPYSYTTRFSRLHKDEQYKYILKFTALLLFIFYIVYYTGYTTWWGGRRSVMAGAPQSK